MRFARKNRKKSGPGCKKMFEGTEKGPLRLELQVKAEAGDLHYSSYAQMLEYEGSPTYMFYSG